MDGFDVVPTVPLVIGDDVDDCAALVRYYAALYIGGMGSREQNFYNQLATRMGYGEAATLVQDLYLAKRQARGGRGRTAWSSSTGPACSVRSTGSRRGCATTPPPVSPRCPCRCSSPMPRTACARCAPPPQALEMSGVGE